MNLLLPTYLEIYFYLTYTYTYIYTYTGWMGVRTLFNDNDEFAYNCDHTLYNEFAYNSDSTGSARWATLLSRKTPCDRSTL